MRWFVFFIIGIIFLSLGIGLMIFAPNIPVHYVGGGILVNLGNGTIVSGSVTPGSFEILVPTIPNNLHLDLIGKNELHVEVISPNGTVMATYSGEVIREEFPLLQLGLWRINVSAPVTTVYDYTIYTTAPLSTHPALIYASGAILIVSLSLLHSRHKKKMEVLLKNVLFEQNIGGRWVFAVWLPIFAFIGYAPRFIPSYPWIYSALIVITVVALFSCIALSYVKFYVLKEGILLEVPLLNISTFIHKNEIYGFNVTKEKRQRWFLLWRIPTISRRKEPSVTIVMLYSLPKFLQFLVLGKRLTETTINFRPKLLGAFLSAMNTSGISKKPLPKI